MFGNKDEKNFNPYAKYSVKVFRQIPPKTVLVSESKFNGKTVKVKGAGFSINAPWMQGKLISLASYTIDYKERNYRTKDDLEVKIDSALTYHVENAKDFEYNVSDFSKEMEVLTQEILRDYVASKTYDELQKHPFNLDDPNNHWLLERYIQFEKKAGVKIEKLSFQNVKLANEETIRQFEAARAQEQENIENIRKSEADALAIRNRSKAQNEAEADRIIKTAKAMKQANQLNADLMITIRERLQKLNLTPEEEKKYLEDIQKLIAINSQGPNTKTHVLLNGQNSSLENAAAMFVDSQKNTPNSIVSTSTIQPSVTREEEKNASEVEPHRRRRG